MDARAYFGRERDATARARLTRLHQIDATARPTGPQIYRPARSSGRTAAHVCHCFIDDEAILKAPTKSCKGVFTHSLGGG